MNSLSPVYGLQPYTAYTCCLFATTSIGVSGTVCQTQNTQEDSKYTLQFSVNVMYAQHGCQIAILVPTFTDFEVWQDSKMYSYKGNHTMGICTVTHFYYSAVPAPPRNVRVASVSPYAVEVRWNTPTTNRKQVSGGYIVLVSFTWLNYITHFSSWCSGEHSSGSSDRKPDQYIMDSSTFSQWNHYWIPSNSDEFDKQHETCAGSAA